MPLTAALHVLHLPPTLQSHSDAPRLSTRNHTPATNPQIAASRAGSGQAGFQDAGDFGISQPRVHIEITQEVIEAAAQHERERVAQAGKFLDAGGEQTSNQNKKRGCSSRAW